MQAELASGSSTFYVQMMQQPEATSSQTCASVRGRSSAAIHAAVPGKGREATEVKMLVHLDHLSLLAVCLSYLKDLEILATEKSETAKKAGKTPPPVPTSPKAGEPDQESPKRKPQFPKRPKAKSTPDA